MQRSMRMKKEVQMMSESPPHGISCWPVGDKLDRLEAQIVGGEETPYSGGIFKLEIQIPERYPFEPPKVGFVTPIYHPNIDTGGRICLDTLKMPPKGAWKPCLNIGTVLTSIQLLMAEPNPDDPLMTDISNEFKHNRASYEQTARQWTDRHARPQDISNKKIQCAASDVENRETGSFEREEEKQENKGSEVRKRTITMCDVTNKHMKTS